MSGATLHTIGVALQAYLRGQGCPLDVVDGPEKTQTATFGNERIVLEHADGGDSFGRPLGVHKNAKHRYVATDTYKATIYARVVAQGATEFEHRTRAKNIREQVIAGLEYVAVTSGTRQAPKSGGFITPKDLEGSEAKAGAVYELAFTYDLPIRAVTFAGAARPEGTIAHMTSTTKVSRSGAPDDDNNPNTPPATADTACGA